MLQHQMFQRPAFVKSPGRPTPLLFRHITSIVASVSGGADSFAALLHALSQLPQVPLFLFHAHLPEAWVFDDGTIGRFQAQLGYGHRTSWQALYELTGGKTRTGNNSVHFQGIHCVRDGETWHGPYAGPLISGVAEFTDRARCGQPPTKAIRHCTKHMKVAVNHRWLRLNRERLGELPLSITGERWNESDARKNLEPLIWEWGTQKRDVLHWRPILDWRFHQAARLVYDFGGLPMFNEAYFLQADEDREGALARMLDPASEERGRPRVSCRVCIFGRVRHMLNAYLRAPAVMGPEYERMRSYEDKWGKTWKQRGALPAFTKEPAS